MAYASSKKRVLHKAQPGLTIRYSTSRAMRQRMRAVERAEKRVARQEWSIPTPFLWLHQLLRFLHKLVPIGPFKDIAVALRRFNLPDSWEFRGARYIGTKVRVRRTPPPDDSETNG